MPPPEFIPFRSNIAPITIKRNISTDSETGVSVGEEDSDAKMYEGRLGKSEIKKLVDHHEREKMAHRARVERFLAGAQFKDQSIEDNARTLADIESRIGDLGVRGYDSSLRSIASGLR